MIKRASGIAVVLFLAVRCGPQAFVRFHDGGGSADGAGGTVGNGGNGSTDGAAGGTGGGIDAPVDIPATGGTTGTGGVSGSGGTGQTGGTGGIAATGGSPGTGGSSSPIDAGPALGCPTTINGSLDTTDRSQIGRESRVPAVTLCGGTKNFPGNAADPSNPHLFDVYQFANPGTSSVCYTFTLTYTTSTVQRYMTAYTAYDPTNISVDYLGDVGDVLTSPQTMGITIPAGASIDVVVFGIDSTPNGTGAYTLTCSAPGSGGTGGTGGSGGMDGSTDVPSSD
jgi:hypothetical protein